MGGSFYNGLGRAAPMLMARYDGGAAGCGTRRGPPRGANMALPQQGPEPRLDGGQLASSPMMPGTSPRMPAGPPRRAGQDPAGANLRRTATTDVHVCGGGSSSPLLRRLGLSFPRRMALFFPRRQLHCQSLQVRTANPEGTRGRNPPPLH